MHPLLLTVLFVGAATWIGGLPTLFVVRRAALRTLSGADNVALFREVGHSYGKVSGSAFAVAIAAAVILAGSPSGWQGWEIVCASLVALLGLATLLGVRQARSMTRARQATIDANAEPPGLERAVMRAHIARAAIAALTVAIIVVAAYGVD